MREKGGSNKNKPKKLYRGVNLSLKNQYKKGSEVVWFGVSSCTSDPDVARSFMGFGERTLFEIHAPRCVGISKFSAIPDEEEYIVLAGTRLLVKDVTSAKDGLTTVTLEESDSKRLVA